MPEDPVWTYFDAQHKFILDQMKKSYQEGVAVVQRKSPSGFQIFPSLIWLFRQTGHKRVALSRIRVTQVYPCYSIGKLYRRAESGKAGSSSTYASFVLVTFIRTSCSLSLYSSVRRP